MAQPEEKPRRTPPALVVLYSFWTVSWFAATAVALLGFLAFGWETSLNVSVAVLSVFVAATAVMTYLWILPGTSSPAARDEPAGEEKAAAASARSDGSNAFAEGANMIVTTQGVVLGLLAFSGPSHLSPTLKAGAASLVTGVLAGSLLYLQVAPQAPGDRTRAMVASILFNILLWSLGFGLVCVVAGNWST
jgi:hypothetical protein